METNANVISRTWHRFQVLALHVANTFTRCIVRCPCLLLFISLWRYPSSTLRLSSNTPNTMILESSLQTVTRMQFDLLGRFDLYPLLINVVCVVARFQRLFCRSRFSLFPINIEHFHHHWYPRCEAKNLPKRPLMILVRCTGVLPDVLLEINEGSQGPPHEGDIIERDAPRGRSTKSVYVSYAVRTWTLRTHANTGVGCRPSACRPLFWKVW
jgi:hypothetical protein